MHNEIVVGLDDFSTVRDGPEVAQNPSPILDHTTTLASA